MTLAGTVFVAPTAFGSVSSLQQVAQVDAMAQAMYPNGATALVIVPSQEQGVLGAAASQLAVKVHGPVLLSETSTDLGSATWQSLKSLTPVAPGAPQPGELLPGKPTVYLLGTQDDFTPSLVTSLRTAGYPVVTVTGTSQGEVLNQVQNIVTPALPGSNVAKFFPQSWLGYSGGQDHNASFTVPTNAPNWMNQGVSWQFPEMNALPLNANFADLAQLGAKGAPVKETQFVGNSCGVSVVKGIVYAESDDRYLYALDAQTGKLLWQQGPLVNVLMGNPVVANGLVYVTAGDTGFPFSQLMKDQQSGGKASLVRGLGYSALYAFNAQTGKPVWRYDFNGNAMPTPVADGNSVYMATGDSHMYKLDAATGKLVWQTDIGGFDSMSSLNVYHQNGKTYVIVGTSMANHEVAVDGDTGKVVWTQATNQNLFLTGMSDNSPSVDEANGVVVFDTVVDGSSTSINLAVVALDASTGKQLWATKLGAGPNPPSYKAGVTMIHDGAIYAGSPATGKYYKLDEKTGQILWQTTAPLDTGPAGTGRGNAAFAKGVLWLTQGSYIFAINPETGNILSKYSPGGRFGMVNPVIVGNTLYADNTNDWVMAYPLSKIYPGLNSNATS